MEKIAEPLMTTFKDPLPAYGLPLSTKGQSPVYAWTIPSDIKNKILELCRSVSRRRISKSLDRKGKVTIHWEREDYKEAAADAQLLWPSYVQHTKLKLLRNRYPVVEGLDVRAIFK